jgi:hypothetical protein
VSETKAIVLRRIEQPIHITRSIISPDLGLAPPVFTGHDHDTPELVCGSCQVPLVTGMSLREFISEDSAATGPTLEFPLGTYRFAMIPIVTKGVFMLSRNGPLVFMCPSCGGYSEIPK